MKNKEYTILIHYLSPNLQGIGTEKEKNWVKNTFRFWVPTCVCLISAGLPETIWVPILVPMRPHFCSNKMKEAIMNQGKLAKLQAWLCIVGEGTAHRKKKLVLTNATENNKKLQFSLKKLGVNNTSFEEMTMFTNQEQWATLTIWKFRHLWQQTLSPL